MAWKITSSSHAIDIEMPIAHGTSQHTERAQAIGRLEQLSLYGSEVERALNEGGKFEGRWKRVDGAVAVNNITVEIID